MVDFLLILFFKDNSIRNIYRCRLCCDAAVEFILAKNPIAMANTRRVKAIPRKITRAQDDQVSSAVSFEDTSFEVPSTTENN